MEPVASSWKTGVKRTELFECLSERVCKAKWPESWTVGVCKKNLMNKVCLL